MFPDFLMSLVSSVLHPSLFFLSYSCVVVVDGVVGEPESFELPSPPHAGRCSFVEHNPLSSESWKMSGF